jgi:hypothetical protein
VEARVPGPGAGRRRRGLDTHNPRVQHVPARGDRTRTSTETRAPWMAADSCSRPSGRSRCAASPPAEVLRAAVRALSDGHATDHTCSSDLPTLKSRPRCSPGARSRGGGAARSSAGRVDAAPAPGILHPVIGRISPADVLAPAQAVQRRSIRYRAHGHRSGLGGTISVGGVGGNGTAARTFVERS